MTDIKTKFNPDAPIVDGKEDQFEFLQFAQGLAVQIANYDRKNSFTIGLNGTWGSGKTSLMNLIQTALEQTLRDGRHNERAIVIPYSPWLVGSIEDLLYGLLPAISKGIRTKVPFYKRGLDIWKALSALDHYSRAMKGVQLSIGVAITATALFSLPLAPWLALVGLFLGALAELFDLFKPQDLTLDQIRSNTQKALVEAKIRVLIIIDDFDRLEPT